MAVGKTYDCIVIGGGHNGLVTAAYLARAGKSVCVLERRSLLGGCSVTEPLWPGYKVSTAAYVISLFATDILRDLRLAQYGLKILPRNPSSFTPLLDGRHLLMSSDLRATKREIAKFSAKDAENYPRYLEFLERLAQVIEPLFDRTPPSVLPLPKSWRKVGVVQSGRDLARMWELYQALGKLGEDLPDALDLLIGPAGPFLERWFESEVLRATLATDAVIGAFAPPSHPGTGYVLLHHVLGQAGGARGVWGYVEGGMGGLAEALAAVCHDLRVDIRRDAEVARILTDGGRVRGVVLADKTVLEANLVASSADAHQTFERFLDPAELPVPFRRSVAKIDYRSAVAKINLALREPPHFRGMPAVGPHLHGTMHIGPTLEYLERAFDDARRGWPSTEPLLEVTLPSAVDSTLAPPGKHVMSIFVQYAPYRLAQGTWDAIKEDFADRCLELLARYAPNVPGAVEHRQVLSPLDLERTFGLTGGHIMQGAMTPERLWFLRPVAGWADHRTPIAGLYLCGAASHPGGGVTGIPGRNAAQEILRDHA